MNSIQALNLNDFITLITTREATEIFTHSCDTRRTYSNWHYTTAVTRYEALIKIGGAQHKLFFDLETPVPEGWAMREDNVAYKVASNKPDFVAELLKLGVEENKLKILKSSKVSELKEVFDNTPPSEDASYEEIAVRFTKKGDSHTFKIPTWKRVKVEITDRQYGGNLDYALEIDASTQVKQTRLNAEKELKKTKLPMFQGSVG
jgi:hypothetical protein